MKKLNFIELKPGTIFNLGNTPSYPKMRLKKGYLDMRDEIINAVPNQAVLTAEIAIMTTLGISKALDMNEVTIKDWINDLKMKYDYLL